MKFILKFFFQRINSQNFFSHQTSSAFVLFTLRDGGLVLSHSHSRPLATTNTRIYKLEHCRTFYTEKLLLVQHFALVLQEGSPLLHFDISLHEVVIARWLIEIAPGFLRLRTSRF